MRSHTATTRLSFEGSQQGVQLGRRLAGGTPLPVDASNTLIWPFEQMCRHAVILGASGTGKSETAMQIAHQVAERTGAPIFYLDAKGDRSTAERFVGVMGDANRRVRVFPNQRFDAWRGDWRAIANRLLEVIAFVPDGPAAYYRDIAKVVVQLACNHPDGPPSSSGELLHRLDHEHLLNAHGPVDALLSLPRERVAQVRMRYQAFFGQLGSLFDGDWSFDDTDAAYFLLDSVALGEDTASAASLLFADFAHYFTARKHPERRCLLLLDEFAALAGSSDLASKVEQARSFNTALVLIPQTVAGLGDRSQRDRVLGSVDLVISHAVNEPDRLAQLAGVRRVLELTHRLEDGARVAATARLEPQPRLDPDQIRTLPVGTAWAICRGQAAKLSVRRAPTGPPAMLPRAQPIDAAPEPSTVTIPRRTSYLGEEA